MIRLDDLDWAIADIAETDSRKEKKEVIERFVDSYDDDLDSLLDAIDIITSEAFDNIGIGKKTALKAIGRVYVGSDTAEDIVAEEGTVSEALRRIDNEYTEVDSVTRDLAPDSRTVSQLHENLTRLENTSGQSLTTAFASVLRGAEVPWLATYAVLDDYKIGATSNTIAMAIGEAYDFDKSEIRRGRSLVPETRDFVERVITGLDIDSVEVGEQFMPMKAKSSRPVDDLSKWVAQVKIDGYRSIIHVVSSENDQMVKAYSASAKDQTDVLPELQEIDWPEGEWIFDSEVVADDGDYVSTKERLQRKGESELPHEMEFWIFDVIMADGEDVSREPFQKRISIMFDSLPIDKHIVPVNAFEDVAEAKEVARDNGYEGTILKRKDGIVEFGKRSSNWIKDKITEETLDLRVAGFEKGTGRNKDVLGAMKLETEHGASMGNVGSGFTDRQREEIWNNQGDWYGEVVEISFDASAGYENGLRFPAFEQKRPDKYEADDMERVHNIAQQ